MPTYQESFDNTVKTIQGLDDSALMGKSRQRSIEDFLNKNRLDTPNSADYDNMEEFLPNALNYGDSCYAGRNEFRPLCRIADNITVGNYLGYRQVTGANIALDVLSRGRANTHAVKIKLLQSYVLCELPKQVDYVEIIYRKNHLGRPFKGPDVTEYKVGAVFDKEFIVIAKEGQALAVQQLLSPDVQATLLQYPRNIGINGNLMVTTFGGRFYSDEPGDQIKHQQAGDIRNQILDSYLIFQQLLEQIDGSYKVRNGYKLVQVQSTENISLRTNQRKRIVASAFSVLFVLLIVAYFVMRYFGSSIIGVLSHSHYDDSQYSESPYMALQNDDAYFFSDGSGKPLHDLSNTMGEVMPGAKAQRIERVQGFADHTTLSFTLRIADIHEDGTELTREDDDYDQDILDGMTFAALQIDGYTATKFEDGYKLSGTYHASSKAKAQPLSLEVTRGKKLLKYQRVIGYAASESTNSSIDHLDFETPIYLCSNSKSVQSLQLTDLYHDADE
jgi:hypothetical protein